MQRSGQVTVTTAGTAVQGDDESGWLWSLAAHPDNTDIVWVGEVSDDVSSANGYPLKAGSAPVIVSIGNLSDLWFDADVSGEKVCWLKLDAEKHWS